MSVEYITHALEKEREAAAWDLWRELYPYMYTKSIEFKDFGTFKAEVFKSKTKPSNKSPEEIRAEMLRVIAAYEGR